MARSAEVVRQWEILRAIDGARYGIAVRKLAAGLGVHERTIRRDIDALGRAGFPLYDDKVNGTSMWKLDGSPFRALDRMQEVLARVLDAILHRRCADMRYASASSRRTAQVAPLAMLSMKAG